jgi:glycosyltransferase involved in cell wall biosynthesis
VSGPKEIIRHQVDGVLIPPFEKEMMAEAICNLIEDEELRCKMARNCEEDIERFSIAQIMNKWNELLESL